MYTLIDITLMAGFLSVLFFVIVVTLVAKVQSKAEEDMIYRFDRWKEIELSIEVGLVVKQRLDMQRAIVKGQISEQIAPFLEPFTKLLDASESRFIGSPIDYIGFKGMKDDGEIEVILIEIKTGQAQMTKLQRKIRKAIKEGRVKFELIRI